jgi:phenylacetate-CoA ligase
MMSGSLWKAYFAARGFKAHWSDLDRFTGLRPDDARRELAKRLWEQIRYFGSRGDALREWREAARIEDPSELWQAWSSLPIMGKQELRQRFHPFSIRERFGVTGAMSSTGGSTGEPTPYLHDRAMMHATTAARLYGRLRVGWTPGMPSICVWGSERDIGRQRSFRNRISSYLRSDLLVDGYWLNGKTVDAVLEATRRHRGVALFGFTSMLEFVAREMVRRGTPPPAGAVRALWNGGEMLYDHQRELFRQVFGIPMRNSYGGRELSLIAFERSDESALSILRPLVFVEIVDKDGRPAAPGEAGRVLCTSLVCRGTPFLRYEIGDMASYRAEDADESGVRAIGQLEGRVAGLLELPNGKTINCIYWNHLLKEYGEVHQFQILVRAGAGVTLRLKGTPFTRGREESLRLKLRGLLGDLPVEIDWMDSLPRTKQGKLLQVLTA